MTERVMDQQQSLIQKLTLLYSNFKKKGLPKRTEERKEQFAAERAKLWDAIETNHKILVDAGAPVGYVDKFEQASIMNGKFYEHLKTWVTVKTTNPEVVITPATPTIVDDGNQVDGKSGTLKNEKGYNDFFGSGGGLKPDNDSLYDSDSEGEGLGCNDSKKSDQKSRKIMKSSDDSKIPQPSKPWNEMIDQENTPNIQQILFMLAQNQLQQNQMKLPDLKLKPFNGDILQYRAFKTQFARAIKNTKWCQVELLIFLKSYLEGEPLDAIAKFDLADANYSLAWELLDEYYDHPRKILTATMQLLDTEKLYTKPRDAASYTSFVNTYSTILANIKQLKATTEDILMDLVVKNIDSETRDRFEDFVGMQSTTPSFQQLTSFFTKEKIVCVNRPTKSTSQPSKDKPKQQSSSSRTFATENNAKDPECFICTKAHKVTDCDVFLASTNRGNLLRQHRVCIFCTKHKYDRNHRCRSFNSLSCEKCKGKHITLMHPLENQSTLQSAEVPTSTACLTQECSGKYSIMPTAIANILNINQEAHPVRCLVDLCAESSYVCEDIVQKLRLRRFKTKVNICGVNGITGKATSFVELIIKLDDPSLKNIVTRAFVVPKVTGILPSKITPEHLTSIKEKLADPYFFKPSFVGALLGCDVASKLFKNGEPLKITTDGLLLQPTHLGFIVSGGNTKTGDTVSTFITLNESFSKALQDEEMSRKIMNFYELPEPEATSSSNEDYCEKLFLEKHYRLQNGRYVVPIPWKKDENIALGHSYRKAVQMFKGQEKKWLKDPVHYEMSNNFMSAYEQLGHMTLISPEDEKSDNNDVYYIPYLSVLRQNSLTTKLRNVFNASMKTSNGVSLNSTMFDGPKLQTTIKNIILTARSFRYIYSADISMMFRQIDILPEDRDKHRIIWRPSSDLPLREYRLNTVTYGTDAAPFLAIRTIHQCADDNASSRISQIIKSSFYMDDLLYGADSEENARIDIEEIKQALSAGQFPLTKWMSNSDDILTNIPTTERISNYINTESGSEGNNELKVLGVPYNFDSDDFALSYKNPDFITFTKRGISAASASFYDPLGFILPFIMLLRIFLQKIWRQKADWDENLPEDLKNEFTACIRGVSKLNSIRIPRHVPADDNNVVEFIGFSDASSHAQAAVIYSRVKTMDGYKTTLITSKGNVSKLKTEAVINSQQCTIPKLELEAMVTLVELFDNLKKCFKHRSIKFTAYTDSKVVLAWVRNPSKSSPKFVERRVSKIRSIIEPWQVNYVKSEENPADPASRGLTAEKLSCSSLWFLGPAWLQNEELPTTPWTEKVETFSTNTSESVDMFSTISSYSKTLRVVAYCLRVKFPSKAEYLNASEIHRAKLSVYRYYQVLHLGEIISNLMKGKSLPKRHWTFKLTPFLDSNNILRVGGRLGNATFINETQRHPIIIPKGHLQTILVRYFHLHNEHANNSLMERLLIEEFWIPGLRNVIQKCIRHCPKCIRWRAMSLQPQMSQLPQERVTPSYTFQNVGVDLSGPYIIKASPLRFDRTIKVWVANFVCLSTKAAHLEIVSSLSTEHFLAAFSRFCCRRGTSNQVWSDNGTNFVGANRYLRETWENLVKHCESRTAMQEVSWKFIPRHSPTFGGLWEACVKSMKYFVRRMCGTQNLTFEEFSTLLCKVEALMNSRPLFKNPLNPEEDPALTPFHFINQRGYKPSPMDGSTKVPLTKKWFAIRRIQQEFWERFRVEYLRELQVKQKWQKPQRNLEVNDIVLVKEPSITPGDWKMARVTKTYPDPKGVVRKVDVFSANKPNSLHAVNQLVPLLSEIDESASDNNEPAPRRSARIASKISLVHLCLIIFTTLSPCINSLQMENLPAGIHSRHIGPIFMKTFDLRFSVKTNLNLTSDLDTIHTTAEEFQKECNNIGLKSKLVSDQCSTLKPSIVKLAQQTATDLLGSYHTHSKAKRWIPMVLKAGKLWKSVPTIATSLGIVYQETQIHSLQNQLQNTKAKLQKTANVLLNVTDIEYEAIESKLNEVIDKQQEILMKETIISYAQNVELLFGRLKSKHDSITSIRPMNELEKFVKPILEKMPSMRLPEIGDEIFEIYSPMKEIKEGSAIVSFTIPLVSHDTLYLWIFISVPKLNGEVFLLNNRDKFQRVVTNSNKTSFADITESSNIHPKIIDNTIMFPLDACTSAILNEEPPTKCEVDIIKTTEDEIIPIDRDLAIVFGAYPSKTTVNCGKKTTFISLAAIVNTTTCLIVTNSKAVGSETPFQVDFGEDNADDIKSSSQEIVLPLKHSPLAIKMRESLKNDVSQWLERQDPGLIIIEFLGFITAAVFIVILLKCFTSSLLRRSWFPEWEGPRQPQMNIA